MKIFRELLFILFAVIFAKFAADNILSGKAYTIYAIVFLFMFFRVTSWEARFVILSFLIFFPFRFPQNFPLPLKYWSELLSLILFALLVAELLITRKPFLSSKASIFFIAVGVLLLLCVLHYVQNPVGGQTFGATSREGVGLRQYAIVFTGTCTFLVAFWLVRYKDINFNRLLFMLLVSTLVIGLLRMLGVSLPFLGKSFIEGAVAGGKLASGKYAVTTGLRLSSLVVVSTVLGLYYKKKWGIFPILAFASALIFSILGAGRGIFWGMLFALGMYLILIKRKHIAPVLAISIIVGISFMYIPEFNFADFKYGRVFSLKGGIKEQDTSRYYNFLYMLEVFKESPIMGKGIGFQAISYSDDFFIKYPEALVKKTSIEDTIRGGSHGSYLSIASTFGIGGLFYLWVMVFGTMYHAYKTAVRGDIDPSESRMALFVFIYASIMSVHMVTGGDGLHYRDMWFVPGIIAGIMARDRLYKPVILNVEKKNNGLGVNA